MTKLPDLKIQSHRETRDVGLTDYLTRKGDTFLLEIEAAHAEIYFDAINLTKLIDRLPFDPLQIYCAKTGQPIGSRSWGQFYALATTLRAVHNKSNSDNQTFDGQDASAPAFELITSLMRENSCASHWLKTDNAALDQLQIVDPVGYFIYAASYLVRHHYMIAKVGKSNVRSFEQEFVLHKIAGHKFICDLLGVNAEQFITGETDHVPDAKLNELHKCNAYLQRILSVDPTNLHLEFTSIQEIIVSALVTNDLFEKLSSAFNAWVKVKSSSKTIYQQIQDNKGPGNFRTQKKSKPSNATTAETDLLLSYLSEFMDPRELAQNAPRVARSYTGSRESKERARLRAQIREKEQGKPAFTGKANNLANLLKKSAAKKEAN